MGPALTNLNNLIRMPSGCGEQNMVNFVPNICVIKYLTNTGGLTKEIQENAVKYMEIGKQYIYFKCSFTICFLLILC